MHVVNEDVVDVVLEHCRFAKVRCVSEGLEGAWQGLPYYTVGKYLG